MKKTEKIFRSRISVLIIGFLSALFLPICIGLLKNEIYDGFYCMSGVLLFCIFFVFRGTHYIISENILYVKIWFIPVGNKDITDIESLKRSYDPTSTHASSLKRLEIKFKGRLSSSCLISPIREEEFISELKTINPNIKINVPNKKGIWRFWDWDI
jgi:hypothetical protein